MQNLIATLETEAAKMANTIDIFREISPIKRQQEKAKKLLRAHVDAMVAAFEADTDDDESASGEQDDSQTGDESQQSASSFA